MSEPRKNHLNIDGCQVKEDEHIATYKPIPDSETGPPTKTLSKSREKVSSDGAEEKLLQKEDEARIIMADAKYVPGDHRNGDAQIELDANKRQFAGLTKEELMKFADDPFWIRVRWLMFVAFWLLWLSMLAGAVAIIYTAPKCARPPPKMWYQKGPLADASPATAADLLYKDVMLKNLQQFETQGVFVAHKDAYAVLDNPSALDQVKGLVGKAKEYGIRVIVDLTASFVSSEHIWFQRALNRTPPYDKYFVFTDGTGAADETGRPKPPNWVSELDAPAFTWREERKQYYYHQLGEDSPQLDFNNPAVVKQFDEVLKKFMQAGVAGVRLVNARELLVNSSLPEELPLTGQGVDRSAVHTDHRYWQHKHTSDQKQLDELLTHWSHIVDSNTPVDPGTGNTVFTMSETGSRPELFLLAHGAVLRPPGAAPRALAGAGGALAVAAGLERRLPSWPALQLTKADGSSDLETAAFSMLLPATPVLPVKEFENNETISHEALSEFGKLAALRQDASIEHGRYSVLAAPAASDNSTGAGSLLVCARWKAGHTGYAAVWNAGTAPLHANLTGVASVADRLTLHYASPAVLQLLTVRKDIPSDKVFVPAESTVVVSYVPHTKETKEN